MKIIKANVAQYINGRSFLHMYECPVCGSRVAKPAYNARKKPRCSDCRSIRHGLCDHPLHVTWNNMRMRCMNSRDRRYRNYGARGISVCPEWDSFEAFFSWATRSGWERGLQIDRIDVNGNYCPENCRFVNNQENAQNTRRNKVARDGVIQIRLMASRGVHATEIAARFGLSRRHVDDIVKRRSWSNVKEPESS